MDFGLLIDFEEKSLKDGDDVWTVEGYAAIFNTRDRGGDIIIPGAFKKSLSEFCPDPPLLLEHDMKGLPIGTLIEVGEDAKGLRYVAELPKDDPLSARVASQIKSRTNGKRGLKGSSFGYVAEKKSFDTVDGKRSRLLQEVNMFEISMVKLPMHQGAGPTSIKGDALPSIDEFKSFSDREREAHFRSLGFSDSWSKYMVKCTREAGVSTKTAQREAGAPATAIDVADIFNRFKI